MRLWSIHPCYLDVKGLVAVWREGLLAQKILLGETNGYKNHPQLDRFKKQENPLEWIGAYLYQIYLESKRREYNFNLDKILFPLQPFATITVTDSQIEYEFNHLMKKLQKRNKEVFNDNLDAINIFANPIFEIVEGEIEYWEKIK